jgi:peptidoglycan L-alanyl-D-glutamate endopeptidase CwlK
VPVVKPAVVVAPKPVVKAVVKPVAPKLAVTYTRTLKAGLTGNDIKQLQTALNKLAFKCGTPDGSYGPATRDAVKRFQSVYLPYEVDGIAGKKTIDKINSLVK